MRRMVWGIVIASILGAAGWWGYTYSIQTQVAEEAERAAEAALQEEEQAQIIWASGKLTPVFWASLGPAAAGVVQTIHVTSGAWVEAGALLMELENGVLAGQVAMAEAAVQEAEAALARLAAAASEADVAAAEAAVA
ncbi:MAG: biotin/lipoyl-binding protein, partial [Caldilinea sp.]